MYRVIWIDLCDGYKTPAKRTYTTKAEAEQAAELALETWGAWDSVGFQIMAVN